MKTNVSPVFLTYFMIEWDKIEQYDTDQKCTECGRPMKRTENVTDDKGQNYEGYVCHADRRVTWVRIT
jgi:hypothetical protein